ncbi:NAD(P)-binding protein [Zopfia rhizophila CBS 207.26]|uniref:NAD(P)-binding protein n=1 Tax=Zopfia rhizophila CBS 207.26 TaxID=1314779 RepID=A0A6A6EEW7_9PEZI|nr:NAD(P)-binding protein [Zopfia rhizophila CBS 207.26]
MGQTLSAFWDQTYFIPQPIFTGEDIPDQTGKVHIITGGYTGIGLELVKLVYPKNATIYIAGRNTEKGLKAVKAVKSEFPASKGRLEFLKLDLADLSTIKASVEEFLRKEERLDVLTNNAGIMVPRKGSKSKQGHDLQTATNIYGPFLFTSLLLPLFKRTVSLSNTGSVRVTWASSFAIEIMAPKGGVEFGDDGLVKDLAPEPSYGQSKAANVMLGVETARRWGDGGIISNVSGFFG